MALNKMEKEVLEEATRGKIKPTQSRVEAFKSLLAAKLIKPMGDNKYQATPEGLKVVTGQVEVSLTAPGKKKVKGGSFPLKTRKTDEELDREYAGKYSHYVKGSVGKLSDNGDVKKRTALIRCTHPGCKETRKVFTSDVFQVKLCLDHKKAKAAARTKESLARLKGKGKTKKAA